MVRIKQTVIVILSLCIALCGLFVPKTDAAVNDYVSVTKTLDKTTMTTEEEATVTLNISGTPPVNVVMPSDVILIIDKSGSMLPSYNNGEDKMTAAKEAAKGFIDLMDMNYHRVGIVDFSSSNTIGTFPLTTDKDAAKNYINGITANGSTATGDAIQVATSLLANQRPDAQPVIVIMTDGDATQPTNDPYGYAKQQAQAAKDAGIVFYTIALLKSTDDPDSSGPNVLLKEMATTSAHHHFVLGSTGLSDIYAAIVKEIGMASAYDVKVTDIVDPNFEIVPGSADNNIPKPTITGNTLTWDFKELKNSVLSFTYKIRPVDKTKAGTFPVSNVTSSITYKDYAGAARVKNIPTANITVKLPAPVITSLEQASGHPRGGETVTIHGKNFVNGAKVTFGTASATNVSFVDSNTITVTSPAGVQGTVTVTVQNPDSQKATAQYQYKTNPTVTSITPSSGPFDGGNTVEIIGAYFMPTATVTIGGQAATVTYRLNTTNLRVTAPKALAAGPADVTITNPDGTSVVVTGGYTYDPAPITDPIISSISPNTGLVTGGDIAVIDGKNFKSGMKVYIDGKVATTTYVSDTRLRVTIPAASQPGVVDVAVADLAGNLFKLPAAYTYTAIQYPTPTVTSISPNKGLIAGGDIAFVDGTNFVSGVSKVSIGGKALTTTFVSSTRLRVTIPAGDAAGKVDVVVTNNDKVSTLTEGYEYTLPVILPVSVTSLTPNNGLITGGTVLYIDGTNFASGAKVYFGSTQVSSTYVSSTRLRVTSPAAATPGKVDITVTNLDGGTGTLTQGFEYTVLTPTITLLTPNHANKVGGDIIFVDGTNFDSTAKVTINGINATTAFISATRLRVTVPASAVVGTVPLVVTLGNGQAVTTSFTYDSGPVLPAPTITSMSLSSGAVGTIFFVDGTNFTGKATVYFGTTKVTTTYVSASRLRIAVPSGVGTGPISVTVVNDDGQASNAVTFTVT
ncbi:hypothetical protein PCCS19_13250 [Paenibacillus sp. CCS19]|uniref:IPT/TIG domain-containing protein n=1 Tax=Paenibacillus sp. CCS19 TaxID=3158387 RepID=UPI002567B093|nr:IPT/TIG domain-containing protein [Paenibacillus cellulosilyticus]GMK38271.1 hypothetical protein PCCS19_13250 [Paenibacillus cellulosilyticus]